MGGAYRLHFNSCYSTVWLQIRNSTLVITFAKIAIYFMLFCILSKYANIHALHNQTASSILQDLECRFREVTRYTCLHVFFSNTLIVLHSIGGMSCDNFRVSPDLVKFTEHPTTAKDVNGTVQLQCRAHVTAIGGHKILLGSIQNEVLELRYGRNVSWQEYRIHWEYRVLGDAQYNEINCSTTGGISTEFNCTSNTVDDGELNSVLLTSVIGSYRCVVYDWGTQLKYSSHHVQVISGKKSICHLKIKFIYQ